MKCSISLSYKQVINVFLQFKYFTVTSYFIQVCHGTGKTTEESQIDAASKALLLIADTGLENGNCVESDDGATKKEVTVATHPPKSSTKSKTTSKS